MGRYVNPGNSAFQVALNSEIYIDKTGLITYTNRVLDTNNALICNSRPRRFGKSTTANMLAAYYSRGCDSGPLFQGKKISMDRAFKQHLNRYNVIHFDVQWCRSNAKSAEETVSYLENSILHELQEIYPGILPAGGCPLPDALDIINNAAGQKFIIIIDEWDALIRDDAENAAAQERYIGFLRGLFKGTQPTRFLHLAYLTGILPIKKLRTQSALNNFDEFTMLDAKVFAPYIGFTADEVQGLCQKYHRDFSRAKQWYDGYLLGEEHIYNPKAIVSLMMWGEFQSYWSMTGTYESIRLLIDRDFDGLKTALVTMLSGVPVNVKTASYQNDMVSFRNKDDILTVLIHLGYLAYDKKNQSAFLPNEEIRNEFASALEESRWNGLESLLAQSGNLLEATLRMEEEEVAKIIGEIHMGYASSIQYNNENSLSSVVSIAYLGAMQYYFKPIRELPAGKGFADLVFLPQDRYPELPALLVELKWDQSASAAIRQIKEKHYSKALDGFSGDILLVGINYDKKKKLHQCIIEKTKL